MGLSRRRRTVLVVLVFAVIFLCGFTALSKCDEDSPSFRKLYKLSWENRADLEVIRRSGAVLRLIGEDYALAALTESVEKTLRSRGFKPVLISFNGEGGFFLVRIRSSEELTELEKVEKPIFYDGSEIAIVPERENLAYEVVRGSFYALRLPDEVPFSIEEKKVPEPAFSRGSLPILSEEKREFVLDVIDNVNADTIRKTIHTLSYDDTNQRDRTRWSFLSECYQEAGTFGEGKLRSYLGPGDSVGVHRFVRSGPKECAAGSDTAHYGFYNIIGLKKGQRPETGKFIICAHYDSRGPVDPALWCWKTDPAPGADDNASGTACVLEAARVLSELTFDFDIEFILFSGEELGLWGSDTLATEMLKREERILGVFNMDMVAYNPRTDSMNVVSDFNSQWLADLADVTDSVLSGSIGLELDKVILPTMNSDHYSFWRRGYDAVHFIENYVVTPHNPYYHTLLDTEDKLNFSMAGKMAKLIVGMLAQFSTSTPGGATDLSISPGDLVFMQGTRRVPGTRVGDEVKLLLTAHNLGEAVASPFSARFFFYRGEPAHGGVSIGDTLIQWSYLARGDMIEGSASWTPGEGDAGVTEIFAAVELVDLSEQNVTNNTVSRSIDVEGANLRIVQSYVYPNPSGAGSDETIFAYELSKPGTVEIQLFDLSGRQVASFEKVYTGAFEENGVRTGMNTIRLSELERLPEPLSSGLYIYKISGFERSSGSPASVKKGKFAILR